MDFEKYKEFWEMFDNYLKQKLKDYNVEEKSGKIINSKSNISQIIERHQKGGQLSIRKIQKCLEKISSGKYALITTEKKPRKYAQQIVIENRFGMKKWKTGRIKIVPIKYRFTYQKMMPYVSIFEFEWKGRE